MSLPKNAKDVTAIRQFLNSVKEQNCSLMGKYSEPIKKLAETLNAQLGTVLAALPADEVKNDWISDDVLNCLFGALNNANCICTQLTLEISKMGNTVAAPEVVTAEIQKLVESGDLVRKDALAAQIDAAIQAKVTAGELVAKTMVDQLCSAAKVTGVDEGRKALQTDLDAQAAAEKLVAQRKDGITQAGLPLPPAHVESMLRETNENFAAAQKRFADREADLAKDGVSLASAADLRANLWLGDAEYAVFANTVKSIPALKKSSEPFAAPAVQPAAARPQAMLA